MRHAAGPRREMGVPTVFNFLGPLTNPARPPARPRSAAPTPRMAAGDGRGARRARRLGAGVPRRRRAGRADHDDARRGSGWSATARCERAVLDPAALGLAPRRPRRPARRGRGLQRRRGPARCWPASAARCATRCCSTRRPRWPRTTGWPRPLDGRAGGRDGAGGGGDRLRRGRRRAGPLGHGQPDAAKTPLTPPQPMIFARRLARDRRWHGGPDEDAGEGDRQAGSSTSSSTEYAHGESEPGAPAGPAHPSGCRPSRTPIRRSPARTAAPRWPGPRRAARPRPARAARSSGGRRSRRPAPACPPRCAAQQLRQHPAAAAAAAPAGRWRTDTCP